jgi:hypothetical protein
VSDADLVAGFAGATLSEFHHRDHVRLAWLYLRREPLLPALHAFVRDLRRFAAAKGKPGLYHETITWGYVFLIRERMREDEDFDGFAVRNPDLVQRSPGVLDRYYRPETLASERARSAFLLPDRLA